MNALGKCKVKVRIGWLLALFCNVWACQGSSSEQQVGTDQAKLERLALPALRQEAAFQSMLRSLEQADTSTCPSSRIQAVVARTQNRSVPFADAASLQRFARGKSFDPKAPLGQLVSEVLVKRRPSSEIKDEKSATDAAFDAKSLRQRHDFLAALHYQLTPPKADAQGFHGGELTGRLGLFDLEHGKLLCATPVFAASQEEVAGKPGQSPQEAADKDFELQVRLAIEQAMQGLTRELNLDLR